MRSGGFYIVSAPSGTGKTTVLREVMRELPDVAFSVSYTTRACRSGEKEGVDYHFVSRNEFETMVQKGAFAEWTDVHGNYYGTPKAFLDDCLARGVEVVLDIDTRGTEQIQQAYPRGVSIFILPPGLADLKERLTQRGSESQEMIDLRLRNAAIEIERIDQYDYVVVNEAIEKAAERIKSIIVAERCRRERVLGRFREQVRS
jgi:guanylate kinase